jgi:allophanate hydrolase subunit 1
MGPRAVIVEHLGCDPAAWAAGLAELAKRDLAAGRRPLDIVPAAETVLITCPDDDSLVAVRGRLDEVVPRQPHAGGVSTIDIRVRYDGPDLADIARRVGLSIDEVVALHAGSVYDVAFCGFAPGFAYLRGLSPVLHLPRRDTPRTTVPAGAVAIAAAYAAVYPRSTPGGWHLLGTSDAPMFDPDRDPPALLQPGDRVRFVPS